MALGVCAAFPALSIGRSRRVEGAVHMCGVTVPASLFRMPSFRPLGWGFFRLVSPSDPRLSPCMAAIAVPCAIGLPFKLPAFIWRPEIREFPVRIGARGSIRVLSKSFLPPRGEFSLTGLELRGSVPLGVRMPLARFIEPAGRAETFSGVPTVRDLPRSAGREKLFRS